MNVILAINRWTGRMAAAVFAVGSLSFSEALGTELEDHTEYQAAVKALSMGLPGVAAHKAEALLARRDPTWGDDSLQTLANLAVEGWTRAEEPDRVIALLAGDVKPVATLFWRGQAYLLKKDYATAELVLTGYEKGGRFADAARMGLAAAFLGQGRDAMARRELKELRESPNADIARRARLMFNESEIALGRSSVVLQRLKRETSGGVDEVGYLKAKALFDAGKLDDADKVLRHILQSARGGERLNHSAQILFAEVSLAQGNVLQAQTRLVALIGLLGDSPLMDPVFELLGRVNDRLFRDRKPEDLMLPEPILDWLVRVTLPRRHAHSMFLSADWLAHQDRLKEALGLLESMLATYPGHPRESAALRKAIEWHGALGDDHRALDLAESWKKSHGGGGASTVDFIAGSLLFSRGEYAESLERFQRAADLSSDLGERRRCLFNAAVASLKAGEDAIYSEVLGQLKSVSANEVQGRPSAQVGSDSGETAADVELNRLLGLAATGDPGAVTGLQAFCDAHGDHQRAPEAWLTLAELMLLDTPARVKAAEAALSKAEQLLPPGQGEDIRQRIEYNRLWICEVEGNLDGLIEIGQIFLERWPSADLAAEIQMKVADAYYKKEDFANARTQFELAAENFPRSDFAEAALFFAGRAAMSLMNAEGLNAAIEYWEELADREGPLALAARLQQALAKRREGKESEALQVVEKLLADKSVDVELRRALHCERAELQILLGETQPERLVNAAGELRAFIATEGLPYRWRARAGYLLAAALRSSGNTTAALEACYDVVRAADTEFSLNPADVQWFYKAGFVAVELLQELQQWEGAAKMAERLAAAGGDRAVEAKDIATKIRLEHFLWEEKR